MRAWMRCALTFPSQNPHGGLCSSLESGSLAEAVFAIDLKAEDDAKNHLVTCGFEKLALGMPLTNWWSLIENAGEDENCGRKPETTSGS